MNFILKKLKFGRGNISEEFDEDAKILNDDELQKIVNKDNENMLKNQKKQKVIMEPKAELEELTKYHKCDGGFKIIILGDVGVGKTSIFKSLIDKPEKVTESTFRPDSSIINYNDTILLLNDTVGQEAYRSIYQNYYREPQIVIFVFDISRMETFMNIPDWQNEVINRNDPKFPIRYYLIANKRDLRPSKDLDGVKKYADDNDMTFIVTSIKQHKTIELLRNNIFQYVDENKDKGKFNLKETLRLNEVPLFNNCCSN
jgi:Ras-related protein Rab-11A